MNIREKERVVLLIDSLGSGGAQRQMVLLANELAKAGEKVTLIIYHKNYQLKEMLTNKVELILL